MADEIGIETRNAGSLWWNLGVTGPQDGAPVILLHGFPEHWRTWVPQMQALGAAGFRVYAPDLPGYGETEAPPSYDSRVIAEKVAELIENISPEGAHLVGHDWGGIAGHYVASDYPATVRSFVAASAPHPAAFPAVLRDPIQMFRSWYVMLFQVPGVEHALASGVMIDKTTMGAVSAIEDPGAMARAIEYYRTNLKPWHLDRTPPGRIKQPGLVIHAERDIAIGAALMERTAEQFDDLRGYEVVPSHHFLQRGATMRFNELLVTFLKSVS